MTQEGLGIVSNCVQVMILGGMLISAQRSVATPSDDGTFTLFTDTEVTKWSAYTEEDMQRISKRDVSESGMPNCHDKSDNGLTKTNSPQIDIVSPSLDKTLSAPLDIDVHFVPVAGVPIRPETFRVCYVSRFVTMDITKRVTDHATVAVQGVHVVGASLPQGHHHLLLLVGDEQGHTGRREAIFDIL